jgi:hypothetical protein
MLEQLEEKAEWEKVHGSLWFHRRMDAKSELLPVPITTGNHAVDDLARAAWLQHANQFCNHDTLAGSSTKLARPLAKLARSVNVVCSTLRS